MINDLKILYHVMGEILGSRTFHQRMPEPLSTMENELGAELYDQATLPTGNGSSVHLFNSLILCRRIKPGDVVVDLACGPANLAIFLAELNPEAQFIGVDLAQEMLNRAEANKNAAGVKNIRFELMDITDLSSFKDSSVDVVISTLALHHLPTYDLLMKCSHETARVLKPNGAIHLMDFGQFKRIETIKFMATNPARALHPVLMEDFENSLKASFTVEEFKALAPALQKKVQSAKFVKTFGVPVAQLISSDERTEIAPFQRQKLQHYYSQMKPEYRSDLRAMRLLMRLGGMSVPSV